MKEPVRLERSGRPAVRALLRVGRTEIPSARVFERTLGALGVAAPTAGILAASLAARAAAAVSSNGATATTVGLGLVAKWLGAGVVAGVVVSGTAVGVDRLDEPPKAAPFASESTKAATGKSAPDAVMPAAAPSSSGATSVKAQAASASATGEQDSRLGREVARIEQARAALSRGDARSALAELDRYEREVHNGRLGSEAMYLRMEAWSRQGDHAQATNAARRLLSAYPDGPHAARAKALVGMNGR